MRLQKQFFCSVNKGGTAVIRPLHVFVQRVFLFPQKSRRFVVEDFAEEISAKPQGGDCDAGTTDSQ